MNTLNAIRSTILGLKDLPDGIAKIQEQLGDNAERLYYLLYGKERKTGYEGPFYNGLENDDWLAITQLVIGWLVESLYCIKGSNYKGNIRKLFYEYSLSHTGISLVVSLLRNNVFNPSDKGKVLALLHDQRCVAFINSQVEDVVEEIDRKTGLFKGKNKVQQIVNKLGYFCTVINSMKTLQTLELEEVHLEPEVHVEMVEDTEDLE